MFDKAWEGFIDGDWKKGINTRDFIQKNYNPYEGDEEFLEKPTENTKKQWDKVNSMIQNEIRTGKIDVDTSKFSSIDGFAPGYIDKESEKIVGLQADAPLRRMMNPYGGMRMVKSSLAAYDLEMDDGLEENFSKYRSTHNDGVFDAYTEDMRHARTAGLLTGLPDAYGRGRIIGDYRRVALYGIDYLKEQKIR